ncbi:hypothetical protein M405DRAFT_845742 [Rhizopogon salebrosus TDB-379]|nr:hypothetical protein M405DRAFT_845742 [Rhizopogon salebrosus TDB-379]
MVPGDVYDIKKKEKNCASNIAFAFSSLSWWWLGVLVTGWHSFPSLLFKLLMLLISLATPPPPPFSGALSLILLLLSGSPFLLVLLLASFIFGALPILSLK